MPYLTWLWLGGCAHIQPDEANIVPMVNADLPEKYGVMIENRDGDRLAGFASGIWIGDGLILTAAHVVDNKDPGMTNSHPYVVFANFTSVPATVVKIGVRENFDLAILRISTEQIPKSVRILPSLLICNRYAIAAEELDVVNGSGAVETRAAVDFKTLFKGGQEGTEYLSATFGFGYSGSGIFSRKDHCLMGIISKKEEQTTKTHGTRWPLSISRTGTRFYGIDEIKEIVDAARK